MNQATPLEVAELRWVGMLDRLAMNRVDHPQVLIIARRDSNFRTYGLGNGFARS